MINARNADMHGGLPLRGKVMNVDGKPLKEVLENEALASIMTAVGLVPGQRVNRHLLRYGKVYVAHDMDEDGKNIGALLINFFYRFWPELFDPTQAPFLYIFMTPFIIAVKGNTRKYWYGQDYLSFDPAQYAKGWEITRAKGLAALKKKDWEHALATPRLMPIVDDGKLSQSLDLIFNSQRANDRKTWIGL
jgi:DNA gyrase/topoisomerase IV subunit B